MLYTNNPIDLTPKSNLTTAPKNRVTVRSGLS